MDTYTAGTGSVTGSAAITVKCSPGLAFKVELGPGATPGGSISQRLLRNGSQLLQYNLYTTSDLRDGLLTTLTVFAEVPDNAMNRLATPSLYSDLVTVTITY